MPLEFRLLGPLEVAVDGRSIVLGGPKDRALLALLLLHAGELVAREALIDELWTRPPAGAHHALEERVSELRKRLREATARPLLVTRPGGYVLTAAADEIDLMRFEARFHAGRRALDDGEFGRADELLSAALAEWRGPPLADIPLEPVARAEAARLDELRVDALEARADARLALGRHSELVAELEAVVREQPFREGTRARLMLALYRAGRQAEALDCYRRGRQCLVDELGIEPGRGLQSLQHAILQHDPALETTLTHLW